MPKIHPQTITKPTGESFTFDMVEVEGGTFMMGLNGKRDNEKPAHEVKLDSFLAAEYPVTQDLYEFVTGRNIFRFIGKRRPADLINWYDAIEFCNELSKLIGLESYYNIDKTKKDTNNEQIGDDKKWLVKSILTANGYRLPTEIEWEYAARGGKYWEDAFVFSGSDKIKKVVWFDENSHLESMPIGLKEPNQLGLYDMSGNISEWCWGWYDKEYYQEYSLEKNVFKKNEADLILGSKKGRTRSTRGGSWGNPESSCKVVRRFWREPNMYITVQGFRIFRNLEN